jgi:class 3 adenylate cyclase/tetratricopeptide (TPR) repeat protein
LYCEVHGPLVRVLPHVLDEFMRRMSDVLVRYGGSIVRTRPSSVLAYFGYPTAHENDPDRAVLAALDIRDAAWPAALALAGPDADGGAFRIQLGVHTGMAVLGGEKDHGGLEQFALGDAAGVASRLTALTLPDGILVTGATVRLLKQACIWTGCTEVDLRGLDEPLEVHGLLKVQLGGADVAPTVALQGRHTELNCLHGGWALTAVGQPGTAVLLVGEPGMGKSLSVAHFTRDVRAQAGVVYRMDCSAYQSHSPWYPVLVWLKAQLQWQPQDDDAQKWAKLKAWQPPDVISHSASALGHLLGLPLPANDPVLGLAPTVLRALAEQLVGRWLVQAHGRHTTVVMLEDVHWADPTTLDFVRQLMGLSLYVVLTARPEFVLPAAWQGLPVQRMQLTALPPAVGQQVVTEAAGGKRLPASIVDGILQTTDGNPFFMVEYTRAVIESGRLLEHADCYELVGEIPAGLIPDSLRTLLTARLDRTGPARSVARHASVMGRVFSRALLVAAHPEGEAAVAPGLEVLLRSGLVRPLEGAHETTYEFQHALVQVTAYESMLRREREGIHTRVAACLDQQFPAMAAQQPELVARHLTESRQWVPAAQRWVQAAMQSLMRCAYAEAVALVGEGQAVLHQVPPAEAPLLELGLLSVLGSARIATTGFGSDEVGQIYARSEALCRQVGDRPETFATLWGNWVYHMIRGQLDVSLSYTERMWAMGQAFGASSMQVEAAWTRGNSTFWQGRLTEAEYWLREAVRIYDVDAHAAQAYVFNQDAGVAANCYLSLVLIHQGRITESREALNAARALAERLNHPFSTAWVLAFDMMYGQYCDVAYALSASQATLDYCYTQGTPFWTASAHVIHGWASFRTSTDPAQREAGLTELRSGLEMYQMTGSLLVQPDWYGKLAECLMELGQLDEARQALDEGMCRAQQNNEQLSKMSLLILQGRWAVAAGDPAAAMNRLTEAMELADGCGAAWLRLRAARHLQPLLDTQGLQHSRLATALQQIEGGEHLPDLRAVRSLLARE